VHKEEGTKGREEEGTKGREEGHRLIPKEVVCYIAEGGCIDCFVVNQG